MFRPGLRLQDTRLQFPDPGLQGLDRLLPLAELGKVVDGSANCHDHQFMLENPDDQSKAPSFKAAMAPWELGCAMRMMMGRTGATQRI